MGHKVKDLIDSNTMQWDREKIFDLFAHKTRMEIMSIPLQKIQQVEKYWFGQRFLLVLDDVWNQDREKWNEIKELLPCGARGSKILITTREVIVAQITSTTVPYFLRDLDEGSSWSLFERVAFEGKQGPKSLRIMEIGKEIVQKCKGNPLAIMTIGRNLYSKESEEEWLFFKNNELSKLNQSRFGILQALKLRYDHLQSHLKHCCAYCSLFPKDYNINKQTLIRL